MKTAAAIASVLLLTGCGEGTPADGTAGAVDDETASTPAPTPTAEPTTPSERVTKSPALGTRQNPARAGLTAELEQWNVTVVEVQPDATDAILNADEFADPPEDGHQYVMWTVEATYTGDDSGDPMIDFLWEVLGGQGNTFDTLDCFSVPDPLYDAGETFPGGEVSGNECASVPTEQIDGAAVMMTESGFDGARVFWQIP